jgi:hypothetical protein
MRIPDCLFVRDPNVEARDGYTLAGTLVVRRPRDSELTEDEKRRISNFFAKFRKIALDRPYVEIVLFNLDGTETKSAIYDNKWLVTHYNLPGLTRFKVRYAPKGSQLDKAFRKEMFGSLRTNTPLHSRMRGTEICSARRASVVPRASGGGQAPRSFRRTTDTRRGTSTGKEVERVWERYILPEGRRSSATMVA